MLSHRLLSVCRNWLAADIPVALVTLIDRQGSSPKSLGSQMIVPAQGDCVGSLTGTGCAEQLIAHEAREALAQGQNRLLRLGAGSPFMDIRLPCGAGITLMIDVHLTLPVLDSLLAAIACRFPIALEMNLDRGTHQVVQLSSQPPELSPGTFRRCYNPPQRLHVIGQGDNAEALMAVARASGFEVMLSSPDVRLLQIAEASGIACEKLISSNQFRAVGSDPWTAAVTLFHDHDWELPILRTLLATDCFYLGALGSRATHEKRQAALADMGLTDLDRIHGPVGLAIGAQTPHEIALSILAEITQSYRSRERSELLVNGLFRLDDRHERHNVASATGRF